MGKAKATAGKGKKKSWTKVKVKEKANNAVFLDEKQYERMLKEVPKILCITRAALCEKFKVGGSIARALIKDLFSKNLIMKVGEQHASFDLYQGTLAKTAVERIADEAAAEAAKNKKASAPAKVVAEAPVAEKKA
jgi:small subunit ribosomal protein S25e